MKDFHEFTLEEEDGTCSECGHVKKGTLKPLAVNVSVADTPAGGRLVITANGQFVAAIDRRGIYRHRYAGEDSGIRVTDEGRIYDRSHCT